MRLYGIRDTLASAFIGTPLLFRHDAPAVRFFMDLAKDEKSAVGQHLSDHELVDLGAFEESTGHVFDQAMQKEDGSMLYTASKPRVVITGPQLLAASEAQRANG